MGNGLREKLRKKAHVALGLAHRLNHRAVNRAHQGAECLYLSAVAFTAHGPYTIAAAILLVMVIIHALAGD